MTLASGGSLSGAPRRRWTTALKAAVGLLAAGGFAWLLARELDIDALDRAFARLSSASIVFAAGFATAAQAVRIVRWWRMLHVMEPGLPLVACVRPFLASVAFNNVLPLRAGDALRVFGFRRRGCWVLWSWSVRSMSFSCRGYSFSACSGCPTEPFRAGSS